MNILKLPLRSWLPWSGASLQRSRFTQVRARGSYSEKQIGSDPVKNMGCNLLNRFLLKNIQIITDLFPQQKHYSKASEQRRPWGTVGFVKWKCSGQPSVVWARFSRRRRGCGGFQTPSFCLSASVASFFFLPLALLPSFPPTFLCIRSTFVFVGFLFFFRFFR